MEVWILEWRGTVQVFDTMDEVCAVVAALAAEGLGPGWFWNMTGFPDRPRNAVGVD